MAKKKAIKLEEVKPVEAKGLLRDVPLENPVELTSVTRFSADHILRTSYNPTSKAVVLEDVPAGLKSEFTLGEGGGGGDGVLNHPLTLTITNNDIDNVYPPGEIFVKDNLIVDVDAEAIAPTETKTISIIVPVFDTGGALPDIDGKAMLAIATNYEVSNMVNCHTTELEGDPVIEIDDITKSSSADIIITTLD